MILCFRIVAGAGIEPAIFEFNTRALTIKLSSLSSNVLVFRLLKVHNRLFVVSTFRTAPLTSSPYPLNLCHLTVRFYSHLALLPVSSNRILLGWYYYLYTVNLAVPMAGLEPARDFSPQQIFLPTTTFVAPFGFVVWTIPQP